MAGTASSALDSAPALGQSVECDDALIYLTTIDGRIVTRELPDFVRGASPDQRRNCIVEDFGTAIYWPDLDEEIGINWMFGVSEEVIEDLAGFEEGPFEFVAGEP